MVYSVFEAEKSSENQNQKLLRGAKLAAIIFGFIKISLLKRSVRHEKFICSTWLLRFGAGVADRINLLTYIHLKP
jgi:undecaprenyl pyrophosphate phosphatase UppP